MSLPNTYVQLEYLRSSGTQYITANNLIIPNQIGRIVCDETIIGTGRNCMLGSWTNGDAYYAIYMNNSTFECYIQTCSMSVVASIPVFVGNRYILDYNSLEGTYKVNDLLATNVVGCTSQTRPCWIFCSNDVDDGAYMKQSADLHRLTIYNRSNEVSFDFIPTMRLSDSVLGLYDLVNDVFYTNSGSGVFIAGPIVVTNNITLEDNPLEFKLENDISLQANFELLGQPVSTIIHPADSGVTYGQGYYPEGATVNMTAVPTPTNKFLGWSNEPPQATNTLPFTMPITFASSFTPISTNPHYSFTMGASPVSLYANFGELSAKGNSKMSRRKNNTLLQKNVVVTVTGNGSVSGVGKYFPYNDCTLTATPEPNNHFVSWSDSVVTNPRTIAISTSDVSLGATFEPDRTRYTNFPQCLGTTYTAVGSYSGSTNIIASTDNPAVTFMGYYAGGGYGTEADYYYYTDALTPLIRLLNPGTGDREWWKTAISSGSSWYKLGFSKPVTFESMTAVNSTGDHLWSVNGFTVQGSNDDSTWTTITSSAFGARSQTITVALSGTYTWIRFIPTSALSGNGGSSFGTMFSFTFTATY